MMRQINVSGSLNHTWIFDFDGTIVPHNLDMNLSKELLPGVKKFWSSIPPNDVIIILTARPSKTVSEIKSFLENMSLRFDHIISGLPTGERLLFNDIKPKGLKTAFSINLERDKGLENFTINLDDCA